MKENDQKALETATKPMTRRSFLKKGTALGVSSIMAGSAFVLAEKCAYAAEGIPDIVAVKGANYFNNTVRALEMLGGMKKYVPKGAKVAILANSPWKHPGSYTSPDVTAAVVDMCFKAGAGEVVMLKDESNSYWRRSKNYKNFPGTINRVRGARGGSKNVSIPDGVSLKSTRVESEVLTCDVFINVPIAKVHTGVRFTCSMKNMMGLSSYSSNRFFHHGSGASGSYDDVDFLSQCIADLNLVRKPDLCVVDATEVLITNGPSGPGQLAKHQIVFAGTDNVAVDSYGATLLGLKYDEMPTVQKAFAHGMGQYDLSKLNVREVKI